MSESTLREKEAFFMLAGREIGRGQNRIVYSCKLDPTIVIKEESSGFQNIIEWETWNRVKLTPHAKWFAPCLEISACGYFLTMKLTTVMDRKKAPEKMPRFLCDFKYQNYGMYENRLVCHDYGTNLLFEYGMTRKMVKANWWDGDRM